MLQMTEMICIDCSVCSEVQKSSSDIRYLELTILSTNIEEICGLRTRDGSEFLIPLKIPKAKRRQNF